MTDIISELRFYAAKKKWPKGLEPLAILLSGAADLLSEADQREKDVRRVALEDAAEAIFVMGAWNPNYEKLTANTFDEGTSAAYEIIRELQGKAERAALERSEG